MQKFKDTIEMDQLKLFYILIISSYDSNAEILHQ